MTPLSTPTSPTGLDLSLEDVREAASRLEGRVHRTPCWESRTFSELCGGRVWLKYENLQRTGSYKLRGALNRILTLPEDARERGVIAASAGNHGQGVAVAAQLAGGRAGDDRHAQPGAARQGFCNQGLRRPGDPVRRGLRR